MLAEAQRIAGELESAVDRDQQACAQAVVSGEEAPPSEAEAKTPSLLRAEIS